MNTKSGILRFISLTLSMVMLVTSVGFAVDMHYCKGELKSFSFVGKAKTCHEMMTTAPACPMHAKMAKDENGTCSSDKKNCCENEVIYVQSDQDQMPGFSLVLDKSVQQFVVAFVFGFLQSDFTQLDTISGQDYQPPLLLRDIPVLIQSFLL